MTDVEMDVAGSEVYDAVKTFLTYCPNGSQDSAARSAMDWVKEKYQPNNYEYRKLINLAKTSYNDLIRKSAEPQAPKRSKEQALDALKGRFGGIKGKNK